MEEVVVPITVSFIGGGAFVATIKFIKFLIERRDRRRIEESTHTVEENIKAIALVYDCLNRILIGTPSDRVLLIEASDSGRIPRPGVQLFADVCMEVHNELIASCRERWQRAPVDSWYCKMLSDLVEKEHVEIYTEELSDANLLKDTYKSINVACSHVDLIATSEGSLFYTSISFAEDPPLSARDRELIRTEILKIKALFNEYHFLQKPKKEAEGGERELWNL